MQNTRFRFGPLALTTTTTTNILNPGTTTGGVNATSAPFDKTFIILRKIRVTNKTGTAANVALWLGLTGANTAGTEFAMAGQASGGALTGGTGVIVPANGWVDWNGEAYLSVADFLVGGASAATTLTIEGEGEIGVTTHS